MTLATDYLRAVHAEIGKLRRARSVLTAMYGPIILVLITFVGAIIADPTDGEKAEWVSFAEGGLSFYALLLLPVLGAMIGAQLGSVEHGAGAWKTIYAQPTSRLAVVFAKLVAGHALLFLSMLAACFGMIAAAILVSFFKSSLEVELVGDVFGVVWFVTRFWAAAAFAMTIHVVVGLWVRKSSLAIGVGVLGMFSSFMGLANQAPEIRYSPWFLPLNILEEGAMAPGDEPLSNATVFTISLIGTAVLSVGAAVLLTRRDVP